MSKAKVKYPETVILFFDSPGTEDECLCVGSTEDVNDLSNFVQNGDVVGVYELVRRARYSNTPTLMDID